MRSNPNIIGRMCMVRDTKTSHRYIAEAVVIDQVFQSPKAKRVRLQTGEHFGEVRMPGEYELLELVTPQEAPQCLAAAWKL